MEAGAQTKPPARVRRGTHVQGVPDAGWVKLAGPSGWRRLVDARHNAPHRQWDHAQATRPARPRPGAGDTSSLAPACRCEDRAGSEPDYAAWGTAGEVHPSRAACHPEGTHRLHERGGGGTRLVYRFASPRSFAFRQVACTRAPASRRAESRCCWRHSVVPATPWLPPHLVPARALRPKRQACLVFTAAGVFQF